jgi:hypothetical protein
MASRLWDTLPTEIALQIIGLVLQLPVEDSERLTHNASIKAMHFVSLEWAYHVRRLRLAFLNISTYERAREVVDFISKEAFGTLPLPFCSLIQHLEISGRWQNGDESDYFHLV